MALTIRELVAKIGFDVDASGLIYAEKTLSSFKTKMLSLTAVTAAAAGGVGIFINEAAKMEQTKVAFEVLLGGAEAANEKIKELTEFARKTPFTIPGVLDSTRQLLAYGIEAKKLIPTLRFLGDISLGDQERFGRLAYAFGQIRAAGKLMGTELRQLTEAGVGREDLAKAMGINPKDFADKVAMGEVSFEMVEKAMISLTGEGGRFFNMMEKGSHTLIGLLSNISDTIRLLAIDIGNEALPEAKKLATAFLKYMEVNKKIIKTNLLIFFRELIKLLKFVFYMGYAVVRVFKMYADVIGGTERAMKLLTLAFMAWISLGIASAIGNVIIKVAKLTSAMNMLTVSELAAQAAAIGLPIAIAAAIAVVILIIEDLIAFFKGEDSVTGLITQKFTKMGEDVKAVFNDIHKTAFQKFREIAKILRMIPGFGLIASIDDFVSAIPKDSISNFASSAANVAGMMPYPGSMMNPSFTGIPGKNQSNIYNIKLDAPINVNGNDSSGNITKTIQNGLLGGLDSLLRETARQNTPVLEF